MPRRLKLVKFRDVSLGDPFFDSLKANYREFPDWFARKQLTDEDVYIVDDSGTLGGFIYLKSETGPIADVDPPLPDRNWLKIGTMKIVPQGTKLSE